MAHTRDNPNSNRKKISGWVDFYRNKEEVRNPIKLNQDLFKQGTVAISYRNDNPDQFANQSMITLGNRKFVRYRIDSCSIISARIDENLEEMLDDETIDYILDEENFITPFNHHYPFDESDKQAIAAELKKVESAYVLTNTKLFFVKKTIEKTLEISTITFHQKNNLKTLMAKLLQLKQPRQASTPFSINPNVTVLFEFENASPADTPIKIINSMTGHHLNDGPSITKQKNLLDWLTKGSKQITYNKKSYLANDHRRDEVFMPVGIHSNEKAGLNIYPWTSSNFPDVPFTGFKHVLTAGCMFGAYSLYGTGLDLIKPILKHDLYFNEGEEITDVVYVEGKNPYEEIVFEDFRKLLCFIQATSSHPQGNEKVQLTYHLPYVDYMLFGIKLFLHNRMSIKALHTFFIAILEEKKVYETRLTETIKSLGLEKLIDLNIQSPFFPLLQLINTDSPHELEKSLAAMGVDLDTVNFPSEEHISGFKQEKILLRNCLQFLQKNTNPDEQKIWGDLIDSHPFIKIFMSETDPRLINFIEDEIFSDPTIKKLLTDFPAIKTINDLISNFSELKKLCDSTLLTFIEPLGKNRPFIDLFKQPPDKKTIVSIKKLLAYPAINELIKTGITIKDFMDMPIKNIIEPIITKLISNRFKPQSLEASTTTALIYQYPNPFHQSPIECSFDLANILFLLIKTQKNKSFETNSFKIKPFEICSFLSVTEKQIQNSFQLFQKKYQNDYSPIINITYFDNVLTYGAQNEKKPPNLTNTTGLAFYFNYPPTLNNELSYLLPLANDNLVTFAKEENGKILQNNYRPHLFHRNTPVPQPAAASSPSGLLKMAPCSKNYG